MKTLQTTNAEEKLTRQILKTNKGLGSMAAEAAKVLADSGISNALSTMIVSAVYDPVNNGRGQSTKSHWFVEALKTSSYGSRLEYIGKNKNALQRFVADMEMINESRDALSTYCSFSFADCFYLSECGILESEAMSLMSELESSCKTTFQAKRILMKAARMVLEEKCATINSAIEFLSE